MQLDFHYYATYCAAYLAGYTHEEALEIGYSAQFVDCCSETFLQKVRGPKAAATTQLQLEMMEIRMDIVGLQNITRIWSAFHFLPRDLHAPKKVFSKLYKDKYRLICGPNGDLVVDTVKGAKGKSLQAVGIAMHVLADTWAHQYFAGTPSFVINNTNYHFFELCQDENGHEIEKRIEFGHNPTVKDNVEVGLYTNTLYRSEENTIMNLGHGRAGHLPDYSFIRYKYLPAWGDYEEIVKDNPSDYYHAFCQMVQAMKYLRGDYDDFVANAYAFDVVSQWEDEIKAILTKRQLIASEDWKAFGEKLSGKEIPDFVISKYEKEYTDAAGDEKDDTFLGRFFLGALAHKSMVTNKIFKSGNILAGVSVDYKKYGFRGIKDYKKLLPEFGKKGGQKHE